MKWFLVAALGGVLLGAGFAGPATGSIPHEQAYVNGQVVTITAIDVPRASVLPNQAQADFFQVVYPVNPFTVAGPINPFTTGTGLGDVVYWQSLGIPTFPQCNPCNHEGTPQIDADDFHDHVLDSMPTNVGFRPIWHVFLVFPKYTGDPMHDQAVNVQYASHLPATSESAVVRLLAARLSDGSAVAAVTDTGVFFLCAVVSSNAAGH